MNQKTKTGKPIVHKLNFRSLRDLSAKALPAQRFDDVDGNEYACHIQKEQDGTYTVYASLTFAKPKKGEKKSSGFSNPCATLAEAYAAYDEFWEFVFEAVATVAKMAEEQGKTPEEIAEIFQLRGGDARVTTIDPLKETYH